MEENAEFISCIFSLNRKFLYTCQNTPTNKCYVTKWECEDGEFNNQHTIFIHKQKGVLMSFSNEGFYLGISTEDFEVKSVNTRFMRVDREGNAHEKEIKSLTFSDDTRFMMTTCIDNTYKFIPNIRAPGIMRDVFQYLILIFTCFYIYFKVKESFF
jgi:hypothetical protein